MPGGTAAGEASGPGPLTVVAAWKIKPGKEAAFEEWHRGISAAALSFPGHLGVSVMRPAKPGGEYVVIFKFDTYEHLTAWQTSAVRLEWLRKADPLKQGATQYQTGYGLEFWFASPDSVKPPPRWKMAAVTTLAIYPLVNLIGMALAPVTHGLSPWIAGLVATPVTIALMTYVVMPFITGIFSRWLFSPSEAGP